LVFGIFAFAVLVEQIGRRSVVGRNCFVVIAGVCIIASLIYFSPFVYGLPGFDALARIWYDGMFNRSIFREVSDPMELDE
jgi:dolichyl-phosphate-mannose--protein O-mannosyl transferase